MSLQIVFRAKAETFDIDGEQVTYVKCPKLTRSHVPNMAAWRQSRAFGGLANSDLFPAILTRQARKAGFPVSGDVRTSRLAPNVTVDLSGFLAKVTITCEDAR